MAQSIARLKRSSHSTFVLFVVAFCQSAPSNDQRNLPAFNDELQPNTPALGIAVDLPFSDGLTDLIYAHHEGHEEHEEIREQNA